MSLVRAENLTKTYRVGDIDVPAIKGLDFAIEASSFVAFVGMLAWVAVSLGQPLADKPAALLLVAATAAALRILKWDTIRLFAAGLLLWAVALQSGLA